MRHGRVDNKEAVVATTSAFVDTLPDTQNEPAGLAIDAGISDLKVLYKNGNVAIPVLLTIQTSTGLHRGVHMSRLVHAAASHDSSSEIETWLRRICRDVNRTQPGSVVTCSFELPYADQFLPVSIRLREEGGITYKLTGKGMTACPCSKKMIGVGHMQRAEITMILHTRRHVGIVGMFEKMEECFSAMATEKMKRIDEARKILEAQENARFAEDLVRECVKRFPNSLYIRARCFESIHAHDAIATWSRRRGWAPELA